MSLNPKLTKWQISMADSSLFTLLQPYSECYLHFISLYSSLNPVWSLSPEHTGASVVSTLSQTY